MKFLFFLLVAVCFSLQQSYSQNNDLNTFLDQHKNDQGATYAFLSKDMFEVATKKEIKDSDWEKVHQVVKNIGSLRIFASEGQDNGMALYKEALPLVNENEFEALISVRDGSDHVRIWVKESDGILSDLVLMVGEKDEFVLVCFSGQLELGNISELAAMFDTKKTKQLAKTTAANAIDFKVSPNPSNGQFVLTYDDAKDMPSNVLVFDQSGRQVAMLNLTPESSQEIKLNELPSGVYWIQCKTQLGKVGLKQIQIAK